MSTLGQIIVGLFILVAVQTVIWMIIEKVQSKITGVKHRGTNNS